MTQPMFFCRRPEVVQAIQVTSDNYDAVLSFLRNTDGLVGPIQHYYTLWLIKDCKNNLSVVHDDYMRQHYIQQNVKQEIEKL